MPCAGTESCGRVDNRRLRAAVAAVARSLGGAPLGCVIRHRGATVHRFFAGGLAPDAVFEIGSIRKSFASALIGCVGASHRFPLEMRASTVWPELVAISGDPRDGAITVHDLVSGVSGWLTADPPGVRFLYNSAASTAAECVLARFLGLPDDKIAGEVARRFKAPLGAASWNVYHFEGRLTRGDIECPGPKLAVDSDLNDLATWGELWCRAGRWRGHQLIPEEHVRLATSRVNPGVVDSHYGYGWFVNTHHALWPQAPASSFGHPGYGRFRDSGADCRAFLWACPALQAVVAIVADAASGFCEDFLSVPNGHTADCLARIVRAFSPASSGASRAGEPS